MTTLRSFFQTGIKLKQGEEQTHTDTCDKAGRTQEAHGKGLKTYKKELRCVVLRDLMTGLSLCCVIAYSMHVLETKS